ncbi:hypothetical protein WSS_A17576 [Rhodococcus opacus M213]|uniref:N-acetyltransferase domain-containing protein n=1 Tax=Rhodococcus opacus M213 TaxID=1129896 RepID=K8XVR0_RHOOP|nr:hypothetical protein WSS_A17576 [Rhodococcus opacus M213]
MLIRRENPDDIDAVAAVHRQAFDGDAPLEVGLVTRLRSSDAWVPQLSLVAEVAGSVAGHVCLTRATVDSTDVLALGPIGVLPGLQRDGVGSALMHARSAAPTPGTNPWWHCSVTSTTTRGSASSPERRSGSSRTSPRGRPTSRFACSLAGIRACPARSGTPRPSTTCELVSAGSLRWHVSWG